MIDKLEVHAKLLSDYEKKYYECLVPREQVEYNRALSLAHYKVGECIGILSRIKGALDSRKELEALETSESF